MPRVNLLGGAYTAPSIIANAQRSVNLFPERNPRSAQAPTEVTHYPRPGLRFLSAPPVPAAGRCLYRATNGDLYAIVGNFLYYINSSFVWTQIGQLLTPANTPAYMIDNGQQAVIVDGSVQGYFFTLNNRTNFAQITDPNFLGGNRCDFLDSFLIINQPGTQNWYSTLSNQIVFNGLFVGQKTSFPDAIVALIAVHRLVWLLGSLKGDVWYNAGLQGFPFQASPGVLIEHGCVAPFSLAKQDVKCYWLSQSPEGDRMVMEGHDYAALRISTHAMEREFRTYPVVSDAIGACYQQTGHGFYKLHFPAADKTWVYDETTENWHERNSIDSNGMLHRERDSFNAFAYGRNLGLDWNNGNLYQLDETLFVDQLTPTITLPLAWIRSLPHMTGEKFERTDYLSLMADIEVGTGSGTIETSTTTSPWSPGFNPGFGPLVLTPPPLIGLRWSDDRGASFGNKVMQHQGAAGNYRAVPQWNRLGMARDRVFELSGSVNQKFALNGVFIETQPMET